MVRYWRGPIISGVNYWWEMVVVSFNFVFLFAFCKKEFFNVNYCLEVGLRILECNVHIDCLKKDLIG